MRFIIVRMQFSNLLHSDRSVAQPTLQTAYIRSSPFLALPNTLAGFYRTGGTRWETYHTAEGLAGAVGADDQRDVQVGVDPPTLIPTLQTANIVLQLTLVQLVNKVSLKGHKGARIVN